VQVRETNGELTVWWPAKTNPWRRSEPIGEARSRHRQDWEGARNCQGVSRDTDSGSGGTARRKGSFVVQSAGADQCKHLRSLITAKM
jgi:hypothetical protein